MIMQSDVEDRVLNEQINRKDEFIEIDLKRLLDAVVNKGWRVGLIALLCAVLTLVGTIFFIIEIIKFEKINTNNKAKPIPKALSKVFVTANVGQIPKINTNTGFSFIKPLIKTFLTACFSTIIYLLYL